MGSMFPENPVFDGCQHRTKRLNEIININPCRQGIKAKKNGTSRLNFDLSHLVTPQGLEPWTY